MVISPGALIAGRYRAERKIGEGSMGEVWAGENVAVGYKVAIKTMLAAASIDHEIVARFKREAFLLGRIRSDYVARVLDFASDDKFGLVLILDLIEGESLSVTLTSTRLSVEEAIEVGYDVVSGLVDLHRSNIVHRDLKPSNIILQPRNDGGRRAIIVDFGVSRLMKSDNPDEELTNITRADMALGTLEYMAPEQMLDSRNVTGSSDLYAVGTILFRAVAGDHAFGDLMDIKLARMKLLNDTPPLATGRDDAIAKGFEAVVSRACRRRPAERYRHAEEMLVDLAALRELVPRPAAVKRPLPSLLEDEATSDTVTLAMGVEARPSSKVEPARTPEPEPAAAQPAPETSVKPLASAKGSISMPGRSGVATGIVVMLVLSALVGGVAIGMSIAGIAPRKNAANAQPATPEPPAPTPPATFATAGAETDAGAKDAFADTATAEASTPTDAAALPSATAPAPAPAPRPITPSPEGSSLPAVAGDAGSMPSPPPEPSP